MASATWCDATTLSFSRLVAELSKAPNLPSSIHVRNLLLSGLAVQEHESVSRNIPQSTAQQASERLWGVLRAYQPAMQVAVLGDAPAALRANSAEATRASQTLSHDAPIWGVAILKSPVFRAEGRPATYFKRPDFSIWISTESQMGAAQLSRQDCKTAEPDAVTLNVLRTALLEWLPWAYERFHQQLFEHFGITLQEEREAVRREVDDGGDANVLAFAMDNNLSDVVVRWASEQQKEAEPIKVDWHATYGTLRRCESAGESSAVVADANASEVEKTMAGKTGRWQLERLGEESVQLVLNSNKLAFPRTHLLRKPFLTCCVRDGLGPEEGSSSPEAVTVVANTYATEQARGNAAGWVYTHEDLSLASLHVPPPYRRLTPKSEGVPSVGRLLMDVMAVRLFRHQRRMLRQAGLDEDTLQSDAWPVTADVEVDNAASWNFYLRTGFVPVGRHTWLGLRVPRRMDRESSSGTQ